MNAEFGQHIAGVAWYSPATWAELRRLVPDPDTLEATYEAWCGVFERGIRTLAQAGVTAVCIPIDVDGLVAWCAKRQHSLDSGGRAGYAADLLRLQQQTPRAERGA